MIAEGSDAVAEAESAVLESLSRYELWLGCLCFIIESIIICRARCFCSHVRAVVATLGGESGAARRSNKWRHLYAGFTIWLSQSEATGNF